MKLDENKFKVLNSLSTCTSLTSAKIGNVYDEARKHISSFLKGSGIEATGQPPENNKMLQEIEKLETLKGKSLGYEAKLQKKKLNKLMRKQRKQKPAITKSEIIEKGVEDDSEENSKSLVKFQLKKKNKKSKKETNIEDRKEESDSFIQKNEAKQENLESGKEEVLDVGIVLNVSKKKLEKMEKLKLKKKLKVEKMRAKKRHNKIDHESKPDITLSPSINETVVGNSSEICLEFNKFDFNDEKHQKIKPKKARIIEGKLKCEKHPEKALERIQTFNEKLAELKNAGKEDKAEAAANKESWKKALLRAEGVKVKDNVTLLKKSLKKKERAKTTSSKQWNRRVEQVEKNKKERQKKRQENIKKKKDQKKKMKIKKSIKKGRVVL